MLLDLPEDVWRYVAMNLAAPDVLSFLCSHRRFHVSLGHSENFWKLLWERDGDGDYDACNPCNDNPRRSYMIQAYQRLLPAVQWYPLRQTREIRLSPREGHLSCVLRPNESRKRPPGRNVGEERVVVTGGFTQDPFVYVLRVPPSSNADSSQSPPWTWNQVNPTGSRTFVYGATLTALDATRAVRMGGFQSGGYSDETNAVSLLTIREGDHNYLSAHWENIATTNPQFATPRAYHSATLISGRYLVVLGGMTENRSIMNIAILDTQTWTWMDPSAIVPGSGSAATPPSSRHGHSTILDSARNRLVVFGGGSGSDLLRSGHDNSEVWALTFGANWETNLAGSFPWEWSRIHRDSSAEYPTDVSAEAESLPSPTLSPAEALCLGRCHDGVKVAKDTALLLFGSGRPSTNAVIGYDLREDVFIRPTVRGPLPKPRFTFASALLQSKGYLFVHGGYTSQEAGTIGDWSILDMAPTLKRPFTSLPVNQAARCFGPVSLDDNPGQQHGDGLLHMLWRMQNDGDIQRQGMAAQMLAQLLGQRVLLSTGPQADLPEFGSDEEDYEDR